MHDKRAIMMRVLHKRFHKGSLESFLSPLPPEEVQEVINCEVASDDPMPAMLQPMERIGKIHYSWLMPLIEKLSSDVKEVIIKAMPEKERNRLAAALKYNLSKASLSSPVQIYLVDDLYEHIPGALDVLPAEYLPSTLISGLAGWSKSDLIELIDFLGLHDLSEEIRQVVDKKRLQAVYNCLNKKEQYYLQYCLHKREKLASPPLGLDRWAGKCEKLKAVLQSRGIIRLGRALSGEHADILWHITHTLDKARGQTLLKYYAKKPIPGVTGLLAQQVQYLMNFLKKKSEA